MRINKKYISNGKMKLENVKVFYKDGKMTVVIDDNFKLNSNKGDIVYFYIQKGYLSWKKNNRLEGINDLLEDIKTNGRANN
jgi:hypothetical protein